MILGLQLLLGRPGTYRSLQIVFDYTKSTRSKARQKAFIYLFGEWDESFAKLPTYMDVLKETNPGSFVYWDKSTLDSGNASVNRVFWAFSPAINGFTHCRPVISIDATHLNGKWKGVLMIAVALDAENEILPLAYALVESENIYSWKWFMTCIRNGVMEDDDWKPQKAYHRICIRHFASNFNLR